MSGASLEPRDAHNERLLANVHPPGWKNPEARGTYNLAVLGGGTAGLVSAGGAAGLGARVALVEKHLMGGDCLNFGCVPSKSLLRSAHARAEAARVTGEAAPDFAAAMERVRRLRAQISHHDSAARFKGLGVDVYLGEGRFTGPRSIEVGGQTLRFARAVIATGSRAGVPPIPGLAEAAPLTNETLFSLTEAPRRLAVIGGGPIGCEMAQAFQRLRTQVILLEVAGRLLLKDDPEAGRIVLEALRRDGVEVSLSAKISRVEARGGEKVIRFTGADGKESEARADAILVAAGRVPRVENLGLEAAGVAYDPRKGVRVDDRLRTTNPRVYAAGDVCSRHQFTHAADFMARTVLANALFLGRQRASALVIPWCTYTDPQVAAVGTPEAEAAAQGVETQAFLQPLEGVDRAVLDGETEGFAKVWVRKGTDEIVGAVVVARNAGDMIGLYVLAIQRRLGLKALAGLILPYPTQAEAVRKTGDLYNRTRLTPAVQKWMGRWLKWRRGGD
ncbi:MAG: mercuric reductase [Candidatus Tectomicrobia bacterium RIFCSPLOWO2_02_FULL_70_19]|nr:MAG: mercuric reductase [Candidatus Tectomicrobia bacterium RIFCSPLOWO2_02_FULL_70_19]